MSGNRVVRDMIGRIADTTKKEFGLLEPVLDRALSATKTAVDQFEQKLHEAVEKKKTVVERDPSVYVVVELQPSGDTYKIEAIASIIWAIKGGDSVDGIEQLVMLSKINITMPKKLTKANVGNVEYTVVPLEVPSNKLYHDTLYEINRRHSQSDQQRPIWEYILPC